MNRKKRRVAGAFAIETVISLTVFMIAILALMMGSMLIRAQAMMQYALNQTAKEMSGYFYLLDKVGIASIISGKETDTTASNVQVLNDSIDSIVSFSGGMSEDLEEMVQNGKEIAENAKNGCLTEKDIERIKNFPKQGKEMEEACKKEAEDMKSYLESIKKDKKLIFQGVLQVFGKTLINTGLSKYVTPVVCEFLMPKYLTEGDPEVFYKATGIKENTINFDGSKMLEDGRTISLVVTYKVDASKLTLGFYKKEIQFHQVACTSAWVRKNDSGSLVSLSDVASYFDVARKETQAEYLHALKAAADKQREEDERLEQEFKDMLETHEADETEEKKDDDKDDKKEIKLPDGAVGTASFMEAYNKLSDRDKELYNNLHLLLKKSNIDLTEAINGCSDKDAALQLVLKYKETGGKFLVYQGNDGLKAYLQLDPSCRILLIQGGVKPNSPEARKLIDLILNEKRKKITEADIQAILKGNDKKDDEDKKEETEEEKQDETKPKMSEAAAAFLEKYPDCQDLYDAYGEDFIKAVNKCDSPEDAIKAIRKAGKAGFDALQAVPKEKTADCIAAINRHPGAAKVIADYKVDALDLILKAEKFDNADGVVAAFARCKADTLEVFKKVEYPTKECTDALIRYPVDAAIVFAEYGDEAVELSTKFGDSQKAVITVLRDYGDNGKKLLKDNGITPEQIRELAFQGLTPSVIVKENENEYNKSRKIQSSEKAQEIIDSYNKIHSEFTDNEIKELKYAVLRVEGSYKAEKDITNDKLGPAVAGVYNKKTGKYYFARNALNPTDENGVKILDKDGKVKPAEPPKDEVAFIDERISDMPDDIRKSYEDHTKGVGSHAEVYAVSAALADGADPDDLLIYVNRVRGVNKETKYEPFVTCPHCAYILQGLNVISNVEI